MTKDSRKGIADRSRLEVIYMTKDLRKAIADRSRLEVLYITKDLRKAIADRSRLENRYYKLKTNSKETIAVGCTKWKEKRFMKA